MTHLTINLLILENDQNIINKINGYIDKFNIEIKAYYVENLKNALDLLESHIVDYIFISDQLIPPEQINAITTKLKLTENNECIIVFHNTNNETFNFISKGNFMIPENLSFDLFKN